MSLYDAEVSGVQGGVVAQDHPVPGCRVSFGLRSPTLRIAGDQS